MRILHTSDWHLGRGLHGANLYEAQATVMGQIVDLVDDERVDAVVVAGDVYDRGIPPIDSVKLLHQTLAAICAKVPVIVTAGNHDSAERLGFGADLFNDRLHIRTRVEDVGDPVILDDAHGSVAFYPFPYLDPEDARRILADGDEPLERSHEAVMQAAVDRALGDARTRGIARTVIVAHAFVVGGDRTSAMTSDSERDITVGTLDYLPTEVFDGASYVALGHLHGRQRPKPTRSGTVLEYSGSPLRYSFSEEKHEKGVTIVEIDAAGSVQTTHKPLPQPRGMARIRDEFDVLIDPAGPYARHREDWVQVTVTDPMRPHDMVQRLNAAFPLSLIKRHEPPTKLATVGIGVVAKSGASPKQVVDGFFAEVTGAAPTQTEAEILEPLVKSAFEGKL